MHGFRRLDHHQYQQQLNGIIVSLLGWDIKDGMDVDRLTVGLRPASTVYIALVTVDLVRILGQFIAAGAGGPVTEGCDAVPCFLAFLLTVAVGLEGVFRFVFQARDGGVAAQLGAGSAGQGRQGESEGCEEGSEMHVGSAKERRFK